MDSTKNKDVTDKLAVRSPRRAFFGQLFAVAGGGLLAGAFLRGLISSRKRSPDPQQPVHITTNPLAVPRTKESKSNV
jgi:hypothetical protein